MATSCCFLFPDEQLSDVGRLEAGIALLFLVLAARYRRQLGREQLGREQLGREQTHEPPAA